MLLQFFFFFFSFPSCRRWKCGWWRCHRCRWAKKSKIWVVLYVNHSQFQKTAWKMSCCSATPGIQSLPSRGKQYFFLFSFFMLNLVPLLKRSVNSDRGNEKDTKKEVRAPEYSVEEGSIKVGGCYRQTYWYKMSCAESQTHQESRVFWVLQFKELMNVSSFEPFFFFLTAITAMFINWGQEFLMNFRRS